MKPRGTNPNEDAMVRRSLPFLATFIALVMLLLAAAPASAYNHVNDYHLRLSRLDPLRCGTPIGIQALLTDTRGHAVSGATIHFAIAEGRRGDTLGPANVVTNARGKAVTSVRLVCTNDTHRVEIVANGPGGAKARITLVLYDYHGGHQDKDDRDRQGAAGFLAATTGSTGTGGGLVAGSASGSVIVGPVGSISPSSMSLLPVGPALLGLMVMLLAVLRRRLTPGARRLAAA